MTQYAIVTDLNRCVGCLGCAVACKMVNGVNIGDYWLKILRIGPHPKYEGTEFPDVDMYFLPMQCQHCENPECVAVCPTQASHKLEDGTVQIDKSKCIGCQFCVMACPYGVRYLNEEERVVEKCTLCQQRTSQGELPQCVAQCGGRARFFGDLEKGIETFEGPAWRDDENVVLGDVIGETDALVRPFDESNIHHLQNVGNDPSFVYIMRDHEWQGKE